MDRKEKIKLLKKFRNWAKNNLIENHKKNTEKLVDIGEFNINPFLVHYLSYYKEGNCLPKSLAKVLLYPRVLGTSISTSFGTSMQSFIVDALGAEGAPIKGLDVIFVDQIDNRRKYCQIKSGPNSINRDDVETIDGHFRNLKGLARANKISDLQMTDMIFGIIYGNPDEKNSFIRKLEDRYPVYIGKEFWLRVTGDSNFYKDLILTMGEIAKDANMKKVLEDVIEKLSLQIESRFSDIINE